VIRQRRFVLGALTFALALLICEGLLHLAGAISVVAYRTLMPPRDAEAIILPDEQLMYRGNPYHRDHDAAGYRNATQPDRADIVVLGDSFAYGAGLEPWPKRLGDSLRRVVYNMSLPGYCPGHSLLLLDKALAFHPRLVILATYLGNDSPDAYHLAQRQSALLAGVHPGLWAAAEAAERERPLWRDIGRVFDPDIIQRDRQHDGHVWPWVSRHVRVYGLARATWHYLTGPNIPAVLSRDFIRASAALTPRQRERGALPVTGEGWRTIISPGSNGRHLDDRDPRIRAGFDIVSSALLAADERIRAAGVTTLVVLFPTKESVVWPHIRANLDLPALNRLIANETRARAKLLTALAERGVPYVDTLETLRSWPTQTYFEDFDGHPNEIGHHVIMSMIAKEAGRLLTEH
jgi:hypothetical protein